MTTLIVSRLRRRVLDEKMCAVAYVFGRAAQRCALLRDGVRFGKGLQLVNILRDLPRDLRQGRCYLPTERLARVQLTPLGFADTQKPRRAFVRFTTSCSISRRRISRPVGLTRIRCRVQRCAYASRARGNSHRREDARAFAPGKSARCGASRQGGPSGSKQIIIATVLRYPFASSWQRLFQQAKR